MAKNETMILESPRSMTEGEIITFDVTWLGAASVSAQASKLSLDKEDYTSTAMSGSPSASGNVQTLEPITAQDGDGGKVYVVAIKATVDGNTEIRKLMIDIIEDDSEV